MNYQYNNYVHPNLQKILFTHRYIEKTKPNYLKPTVSSIMKRSYLYREKNTLLSLGANLFTYRYKIPKMKMRYDFNETIDDDYYQHYT